ncbi:MAG: LCP family protein [Chloroflexi bacterium]|nr:LCP family protein [Chloroflexota bacterium]
MKKFFSNLIQKVRSTDRTVKAINLGFLILAIVAGVYLYGFVATFVKEMTILNLPGAPVINESVLNDANITQAPTTEAFGAPTPEPWDGVSRVNVLFMGLDYRDWEAGETPRSDTMIMFTVDPVTNTAGMLSIPRDLWVSIPGFGYYKINEAYFLGEGNKLPGGGPALAVATVEELLGVPIQYYAQVDFSAFISFIDEIGGIVITPNADVKVEEFGSEYDQILKAGEQYSLPGSLALSYARNRYTGDGDFGRAQRQQQVITAIMDRILQYNQLPTLITKAPALYADLSSGIRTNLDLPGLIKLATLMLNIPTDSFQKAVIGTDMILIAKSPTGLDILKPIPDKIRELRDQIFATGGSLGPIASPSAGSTLARDEAAIIAVKNGTSEQGLATRTVDYLKAQGLNATEVTADQSSGATMIIAYNSKPHTVAYLANLMNVSSSTIIYSYDSTVGVDVVVIVGNDWAATNPMP